MESLISETRLPEELAAFKATAGLLATQKIRYSSTYVPPLQDRHRKATLVNVSSLSTLEGLASKSELIRRTDAGNKGPGVRTSHHLFRRSRRIIYRCREGPTHDQILETSSPIRIICFPNFNHLFPETTTLRSSQLKGCTSSRESTMDLEREINGRFETLERVQRSGWSRHQPHGDETLCCDIKAEVDDCRRSRRSDSNTDGRTFPHSIRTLC